jgi:hypothetical protein
MRHQREGGVTGGRHGAVGWGRQGKVLHREGVTHPYGEHEGNWSDNHEGGSEDGVGCVEEKEKGWKESGGS